MGVMGIVVRAAIVLLGLGIMLAGIIAMGTIPDIGAAALWWVFIGGVLVVAVAAEQSGQAAGPGGGETADAPLDPRFRPTAEVFLDPTSGRRMRVLVDPATGERRYVAEA
jgi:hypothetical protein